MLTMLKSWELCEENRLTFLWKNSHSTVESVFDQLSQISIIIHSTLDIILKYKCAVAQSLRKNCSEVFYLLKPPHAQTKLAFGIKCSQLRQMGPSIKLPVCSFFLTIRLNKKPLLINAKTKQTWNAEEGWSRSHLCILGRHQWQW